MVWPAALMVSITRGRLKTSSWPLVEGGCSFLAQREVLGLEAGQGFLERGGVGKLLAFRFRGMGCLIEVPGLFVEVGIGFCQFLREVFQTGFLRGRERGQEFLVAGASLFEGLIDGGCALGEGGRSRRFRQRFAKGLQLIGASWRELRDLDEGGALIGGGLEGQDAMEVLEIVFFADSRRTAAAGAGV